MFPKEEPHIQMDPLLTYKASSNRNNLYMHEEVKAPDQKEFIAAMLLLGLPLSPLQWGILVWRWV